MRLLKNKSFRLLVWATLVSSFGDSLYALAITLSVYEFRDRWQAWDTR